MKKYKNFLLITLAFIAGGFATLATSLALAHGGDTNLIHGCVRNTLFNGPNLRIIGENDNCNGNETALDWPKTAGGSSDFVCVGCSVRDVLLRLNQPDLSNVDLDSSILTYTNFINQNVTGSSFIEVVWSLGSGSGSDFTDTNFSYANLSNSNFGSDSVVNGANFTRANLTGVDFTLSNLKDAIMNDAITTDAIWNGTVCPDNTNSNDNGDTCEGHLTP